eukprot:scaffold15502_cov49-Prasinocladus_malaysianus.AAC.1
MTIGTVSAMNQPPNGSLSTKMGKLPIRNTRVEKTMVTMMDSVRAAAKLEEMGSFRVLHTAAFIPAMSNRRESAFISCGSSGMLSTNLLEAPCLEVAADLSLGNVLLVLIGIFFDAWWTFSPPQSTAPGRISEEAASWPGDSSESCEGAIVKPLGTAETDLEA